MTLVDGLLSVFLFVLGYVLGRERGVLVASRRFVREFEARVEAKVRALREPLASQPVDYELGYRCRDRKPKP